MSGRREGSCKFFQSTSSGRRCVFLSPEEWRLRKDKLISYCSNGGGGCPLLARYMAMASRLASERRGGRGALF